MLDYTNVENQRMWNMLEDWDKHEFNKADFVVSEINKRLEREANKQKQIEELAYEKSLITNDLINIIKQDLHYSKFNLFYGLKSEIFSKTWNYFWHKKDLPFYGKLTEIILINTVYGNQHGRNHQ